MTTNVKPEIAGQGWTDAFQTSTLPTGRAYDRLVAISRSGTTTEVLAPDHPRALSRSVILG